MFKASIDTSLTQTLNNWGVSHQWITRLAAKDFLFAIIALGVLWIFLDSRKEDNSGNSAGFLKKLAIDGFFVFLLPSGVTIVAAQLIAHSRNRPRPFIAHENISAVIHNVSGGSFPAVQVAFMTAISMAIFLRNRQAGNGLMYFTVIAGIAQIAAGIQYPTDIIFGIFLGVVVTVGLNRILMRLMSL